MSDYNQSYDDWQYRDNVEDDDYNYDIFDEEYSDNYFDEPEDDDYADYQDDDYFKQRKSYPISGKRLSLKKLIFSNNLVNIPYNKKGLKWELLKLYNERLVRLGVFAIALLLVILIILSIASCSVNNSAKNVEDTKPTVAPTTKAYGHMINNVPVIVQDEYKAACETYACVMLLQSYKFDIDVKQFIDNYLLTKPVYYGIDGNLYGPDMNSAYAGDVYTGYGINCPGMSKCINSYLETTDSKLKAYPIQNVSLEQLCTDYIDKDVPVMVWATTYMEEPYVKANWIVDYVDESISKVSSGESESWQDHEHCMVLVGYDENNYYFCDSVAGKVASYDKKTSQDRYEKIGKQAIILK